jgi:MFS family permease
MNDVKKYSWWPLFFTNFFGVFNDNLIKWLVIFVGVTWVSEDQRTMVISVASAALVLPFIIFSPRAGRIAKKHMKSKIMVVGKALEIPIMLIAIYGFYTENLYVVMVSVLLMGTQSAFFSPAKYGLIRDIKGIEGIPFGTGSMEMLTFTGILLGTVSAGIISDYYNLTYLSVILLVVAIIGFMTSKLIKATESQVMENPQGTMFFLSFIIKQFKLSRNFPGVNYAVFGLSMFWMIGALIQMNLKTHGDNILMVSDTYIGYVMALAAIGIAIGSILTGWLSNKRIHLGFVFIGSIGLGIMSFLVIFFNPGYYGFLIMIFFTSFFGGFYKVPLNAYIQSSVKGRLLGDTLAYENIMEFLFILMASIIFYVINTLTGDNSLYVFGFIGMSSILVGIYFFLRVPGVKQDFVKILQGKLRADLPKD